MRVRNTGAGRGALEDREIPHSRNPTKTPGEKDIDWRASKQPSRLLVALSKSSFSEPEMI